MNIEEFLDLRGTSLPSVVAQVQATIGPGPDDILLAVGSLAECIGNSKSDLDLLLITPRRKRSLPPQDNITLVSGKCVVDVRILRLVQIEELLTRLQSWARIPWNVVHAVKFALEERTLLHRLLHGRVLYKGKRAQLKKLIPSRMHLSRLKLHVARQMARTIQVDMVGYRETGDYSSLVFAAQEVVGNAVDALLAGYQITNPLSKWRSRMLGSLPSDWERSLGIRPSGLAAGPRVWSLHRAPERPDKTSCLEHALQATTFARAVFMWAELQLLNRGAAKQKLAVWPKIERKLKDWPLPYLDFDVDFFIANGRLTVARLNEFDKTIEMPPRQVVLFDGATTTREAGFIVYGARNREAQSLVERLVSQVAGAGFCLAPKT